MSKITLTWDDLNASEEGHRVYRSLTPMDPGALPSPLAVLGPNVTTYDDLDIVAEELYYYRVSVYSGALEKTSGEVSIVAKNSDPLWGNVAVLLHFDSSLTDQVGNSWVLAGAPPYVAGPPGFGQALGWTGVAGQVATTTLPQPLGTSDFTIEMFLKFTGAQSAQSNFFEILNPPGNPPGRITLYTKSGSIRLYSKVAEVMVVPLPPYDVWTHLALESVSGVVTLYLGGVAKGTWSSGGVNFDQSELVIGAGAGTVSPYAHMDELRITRGVARYSGAFTPPTEPFLP